ncbi:unnamed protein product [Cylicocyclus nassatus]|uniref:Glycosyltransferase family 92 protein n=1 Tax=Cylicocyclus nassatus TaxID=53992 RepID=A0AA36GTW5_CYLNA|nr:unnamed protein product [Cylicocyclus nassatus]
MAIDYRRYAMMQMEEDIIKKKQRSDFMDDIDYALESMKYMHDMQNGKAKIRPVVERKQPVVEYYWWCRIDRFEKVSNSEWTENDGLYLYNAYLDTRQNSLYPWNDAIQILSMSFRTLRHKVYCNIYDEKRYAVVEGYVREIWQRGWDPRDRFYIPNLITCPIPKRFKSSKELYVSITSAACSTQRTAMRVRIDRSKRKKDAVAVCVKGLDFQTDLSVRLVEWLEAQYLFGASAVTIYKYTVSKKMDRVLDHYEKLGKLTQIPLTLPGHSPNLPVVRSEYIGRNRQQKRRHELIPYNDCLYRHIPTHRYILILDIDEVVVPIKHNTYAKLIDAIEASTNKEKISSLSFSNVFKFPAKEEDQDRSRPEHMFMLRNIMRTRKTSNRRNYGKSMTNTGTVASVFNHFALHRLSGKISPTMYVPEKLGIKLHYKSTCPIEAQKDCDELQKDTVRDHSLDRFADELERRVNLTLAELDLLQHQ